MKQYLDLIKHIRDNGSDRPDRTGVGTRGIFGYQMRFNLSDGFPIVTSRFIPAKVFITEMIWMLTQQTSTKWLHDNGLSFWDDWADHNDNLGPIYNHQFTNFGGMYDNIPHTLPTPIKHFDDMPQQLNIPENLLNKFTSNKYGDYIVIENVLVDHYKIQFCATGYSYIARVDKILSGSVYDPYYPSQSNAGYLGEFHSDPDKFTTSYSESAYARWRAMLARCYDPQKSSYPYYGGIGVFVCDRWLNFSNYLIDLPFITGWNEDKYDDLELDKDILGTGFEYSPSTCKFVSHSDNMEEKSPYKYTLQNIITGAVASFINSSKFRTSVGIKNQGNFDAMLRGERKTSENWKLIGVIDRRAGINQIQNIINSLQTDPYSRRHVMTLWNPMDLSYQALACCHGTVIQFFVDNDNRLSCQMYQRSCDAIIGLPHNIGEYALLTHMIAKQCGFGVGELIWSGGDVHIYLNHLDQVDELVNRTPKKLPMIELNSDGKSIFDYTPTDIKLIDYDHHPAMKFKIAV